MASVFEPSVALNGLVAKLCRGSPPLEARTAENFFRLWRWFSFLDKYLVIPVLDTM